MKPACFDDQQWADWMEASRAYVATRNGRDTAGQYRWCRDCTPEYQAQMVAQERCANPQFDLTYLDKEDAMRHVWKRIEIAIEAAP